MNWISVRDRLPSEMQAETRLLLRDGFNIDYLTGYYLFDNGYWLDKEYNKVSNISHWCEITEPSE